jgi:hypothetical protein
MKARTVTKRFGLSLLLALAAGAAAAAPASADLVFRASVSGTYDQQWKVDTSDPTASNCVVGGGEQTLTLKTAPRELIHAGMQDEGPPSSNGHPWQFGPFKVTGMVTRTDNTARDSSGDCAGSPPMPRHDCGGPRKFTVKHAWIYKWKGAHRAKFHIELEGFDPGTLFEDTRQCFAPDFELGGGLYTLTAGWPGDRGVRPRRTYTIGGLESFPAEKDEPFYLPDDDNVPLDITTGFLWKAGLRAKCYAARLTGTRCQ